MFWRAVLICLCLGAIQLAHASDVTTYGAGLSSCKDYTVSRDQGTPDLVAYTDWLSGYLSGVNTTSNHRNNFLSHDDLESAMNWLGDYCLRHPTMRVAEAAWMLILSAKSGPAAHAVEVAAYGAGYKSCQIYVLARSQQSIELNVDQTEFIAWLGGYLSGVNAISLATANALGKSGLDDAVQWLDGYCGGHEESSFAAAVRTLIAPDTSADRKALAAAETPIIR
jgi:hypothetical protein